jgi:hypothetical protein
VIIHTFGWKTAYLDRIRKGKPIIVHGDGNSLWVMCHVDDVARAHLVACGNPKAYGRAYHTTGEEWLTWNRYHHIIAEVMMRQNPAYPYPPSYYTNWRPTRQQFLCSIQYSNIFDNSNTSIIWIFAMIPGKAHLVHIWLEAIKLSKIVTIIHLMIRSCRLGSMINMRHELTGLTIEFKILPKIAKMDSQIISV